MPLRGDYGVTTKRDAKRKQKTCAGSVVETVEVVDKYGNRHTLEPTLKHGTMSDGREGQAYYDGGMRRKVYTERSYMIDGVRISATDRESALQQARELKRPTEERSLQAILDANYQAELEAIADTRVLALTDTERLSNAVREVISYANDLKRSRQQAQEESRLRNIAKKEAYERRLKLQAESRLQDAAMAEEWNVRP